MRSLYQVLKASKFDPVSAPDMFTALWAKNISGGGSAPTEHEYTGTVPTTIIADGNSLLLWSIYGNLSRSGTPTPDSPIYPSETGDRTENLFSETLTNGYTLNGTTGLPSTYAKRCATLTPVMLDNVNTITLSYKASLSRTRCIYSIFNGDTLISRVTAVFSNTTIDVSTADRIYLCFYDTADTETVTANDVSEIMIVEGSTAPSSYIPPFKLPVLCGGVTTPVYLTEPIRKIGEYTDYKSESAEYRAVKKVVLTGNETITLNGKNDTREVLQAYYTLPSSGTTEATNIICSHLETLASGASTFNSEGIAMRANGTDMIFGFSFAAINVSVSDSTAVALTKLMAYLSEQYAAGTPVTVWYILATPTTTTVEGPEIPTSDGEQTFDVTTELEPSSVYVKYKG